jgi:hypothetical protein
VKRRRKERVAELSEKLMKGMILSMIDFSGKLNASAWAIMAGEGE